MSGELPLLVFALCSSCSCDSASGTKGEESTAAMVSKANLSDVTDLCSWLLLFSAAELSRIPNSATLHQQSSFNTCHIRAECSSIGMSTRLICCISLRGLKQSVWKKTNISPNISNKWLYYSIYSNKYCSRVQHYIYIIIRNVILI